MRDLLEKRLTCLQAVHCDVVAFWLIAFADDWGCIAAFWKRVRNSVALVAAVATYRPATEFETVPWYSLIFQECMVVDEKSTFSWQFDVDFVAALVVHDYSRGSGVPVTYREKPDHVMKQDQGAGS